MYPPAMEPTMFESGSEEIDDPESYLMDRSTLAKGEAGHTMTVLPEDFVPGDNDVICGRGRKIFMHPGNERFRSMVSECLEEYSNTVTKLEKSYILCDIVAQVRANAPNGGFVKKDTKDGRWYEVGDFLAREKTSQAFRDALHEQYKSSNTAKKIRRQAEGTTKVPRRAFSTTELDSKILGEKPKIRDGYSDPLLAKLRHQKSARSVFEFTENGSNAAARGVLKSGPAASLLRASCPNLNRARASTGTMPSSGTHNFDWGSSRETNSSTANFEWKAAQESKSDSLAGGANFDWGFPKTSTPLQRISEVGKLNLFSKFTVPSLDAQHRRSSLDSLPIDPNFDMSDLEPNGNGSSSNFLLGVMASPDKNPSPMLSTATMDIESKLRALRKSTFESTPATVPELEPLGDDALMDLLVQDEAGDTFDKLVELVGDVDSLGDDPFEPSPLP